MAIALPLASVAPALHDAVPLDACEQTHRSDSDDPISRMALFVAGDGADFLIPSLLRVKTLFVPVSPIGHRDGVAHLATEGIQQEAAAVQSVEAEHDSREESGRCRAVAVADGTPGRKRLDAVRRIDGRAGQAAVRDREADERVACRFERALRLGGASLVHLGRERHEQGRQQCRDDHEADREFDEREAALAAGCCGSWTWLHRERQDAGRVAIDAVEHVVVGRERSSCRNRTCGSMQPSPSRKGSSP
jgi:hypothetical protein